MKINIFFFSKWKWKADALIQTLYKRAGLGQKKRNSFSPCARARPLHSRPLPTPLFSFATSRPYPRLATSKIPPSTLHGERVQREETKTPVGAEGRGAKEKFTAVLFYISALPPPTPDSHQYTHPTFSQSAIYRTTWQSTDIKKNKRKWRVSNARADEGGDGGGGNDGSAGW